MLNHFSAKLAKIDDWKARAQYMYRDWRPGKSQTCRRLCVRLGDSLHRAESPLHVWGKGHPVQKATPVPQERPNLGTNSFKFQWAPKFTNAPRGMCVCFGGEGPRAEGGRGEETSAHKGFDTPRVGGF